MSLILLSTSRSMAGVLIPKKRFLDCARWGSGLGRGGMLEQISVHSGLANQALWAGSEVSRVNEWRREVAKVVGYMDRQAV